MKGKTFYQEKISFSYEKQKQVEVIHVIRTELLERGEGTEKDPRRKIEQYYSISGDLLWENDPYLKSNQKNK